MIETVKDYYKSWETNDVTLLNEVLSPQIYGIRTYQGEKLFSNLELKERFLCNDIKKVTIVDYEENENIVTCNMVINDENVSAKLTFINDKIHKVFEEKSSNCRRIQCVVSYDGSEFSGYQKQLNAPSVQATIEAAIKNAFKLNEIIPIHSSGRTDKGVHAINQVFHFDLDTKLDINVISTILNNYLPDSIYIKSSVEIAHTLHSRYDVKEKEYMYKINLKSYDPIQRNYEWYIKDFDLDVFTRELDYIKGTHDFTSFTKNIPNHSNIRTIYDASITIKDDFAYIHIKGNGFLRYMVRNIIGAIYLISTKKSRYSIQELLTLKDVSLNNFKAPASGLYLFNVKY